MKTFLFFLFIFFSSFLAAQKSGSWSGIFNGQLVDIESTLSGETNNADWKGTIDASGYLFDLTGTLDGMNMVGTMSDPQTGSTLPFRALLTGDKLAIYIHDINPLTGVKEEMELVFMRSTAKEQTVMTSNESPSNVNIDPQLVGTWRYTDSYVSGQFSFATDYFMYFNRNGTMAWTDGRTAGGGPDISMDSGRGDVHKADWKIDNKVIWLNGGSGWEYYAIYYVEPGRMMLTFKNGNKQVWEKL